MSLSLREILDLKEADTDSFHAPAAVGGDRLYGGFLLGQAFVAAMRTVAEDRQANSIQATFLRAGVPGVEVTLDVERVRDGGSFSSRQVIMHQEGRELLRAMVSAHTGEDGDEWQGEVEPPVISPEDGYSIPKDRNFAVMNAFEIRTAVEWNGRAKLHPYWIRLTEPIGEEPYLQHAALLTVSDLTVIRTARAIEAPGMEHAAMSLDHTLWFHRTPKMADWTYVHVYPTINSRSRGMAQGRLMNADGQLLASMSQEALMRMPRRPEATEGDHTIAG